MTLMDTENSEIPTLHEMLALRNRQITAVHQISRVLSSSLDLDDRLRDILKTSMQAVDADAGTVYLYRPADDKLVFRLVIGEKSEELTGRVMPADAGVAGAVFQSGESRIAADARSTGEHDRTIGESVGFDTKNIIAVPLKYQAGRPVGVMQVLNKRSGAFDSNDLEVLEIVAAVAATAIENAQLHRDAQLSAVAHAVGDLSHDIKNKVTPISLSVDTLAPLMDDMFADLDRLSAELDGAAGDSLRLATEVVREFAPESFKIIQDQVLEIQEFTKLIADTVKGIVSEPLLEPHDLNHIVMRQLDALEPVAKNQGALIIRELNDVPAAKFDRFSVERAIYNLVNNAIPETPAGGSVTVTTSHSLDGIFPTGKYLQIQVEDTGRGMPQDVLDRILRGDTKSTKPGGTGLGTKIVFNAVAAHHGVLEGESWEGQGTTFRIKLPLLIAATAEKQDRAASHRSSP